MCHVCKVLSSGYERLSDGTSYYQDLLNKYHLLITSALKFLIIVYWPRITPQSTDAKFL